MKEEIKLYLEGDDSKMAFICLQNPHYPFRDIIYHQESKFKVQVYNMQHEHFVPNANEVHFFGDDHGDELAFETVSYNNQSERFIKAAIAWYSLYIAYPEMKVYRKNPT
jgi:hypothetical protein